MNVLPLSQPKEPDSECPFCHAGTKHVRWCNDPDTLYTYVCTDCGHMFDDPFHFREMMDWQGDC